MKKFKAPLIISLLLPAITMAQEPNWQNQVNELINQEMKQYGLPSLQVAIGHKNQVIYEYTQGLADIEHQVKATSQTKYRIASISKWLTSKAAMKLVDANKLDLDAPIQNYCPEYPKKPWTITTRQLLTHTSGIRHYANFQQQIDAAKDTNERNDAMLRRANSYAGRFMRYTDMQEPLDNFKNDPLLFKPETDWKYTSFGYRVLGCVLEGSADKPYRALMKDSIFTPIGMKDTTDDDAWKIVPHRASGYRLKQDKTLRRANMRDISENLPAGGHLSTASDLVKFALAFTPDSLSSSSYELISQPLSGTRKALQRTPTWRDAIPAADKYSYGTMFFPNVDRVNIGHSGRQAGADSMVVLNTQSKLAFAVLTNVKGYNGGRALIRKIEDIMLSQLK